MQTPILGLERDDMFFCRKIRPFFPSLSSRCLVADTVVAQSSLH